MHDQKLTALRTIAPNCMERWEKEFAAKPSEARSSAISGTKNLKSPNPKGTLLRAGGRGGLEGIPPAQQSLGEISSNIFESTPPFSISDPLFT